MYLFYYNNIYILFFFIIFYKIYIYIYLRYNQWIDIFK